MDSAARWSDRVEAREPLGLDVAHVAADRLDVGDRGHRGRLAERAPLVQVAVEADDLVAGVEEHRHEHGADVAEVAGDEDAQGIS